MDRRAAGALLALAACFATATAAPTSNHTALDLYDGPSEGCYYNFQHYGEGDRIMTNEPCLNCTCHNRMLMCYLRVCPFTKPIGQDCTVEKRADQCCPIVTCPDVPVDLLTSTSTTSPAEYGGTGVGKVDNYGCSINGKYFPEGAKVPPTPNKPCEHCYCIRNMTTCVMQECTLHVDGCTPIYHKDVCCPVRYFCDHPEDEETLQLDDMTTTVRPTPGFLLTTMTTEAPTTEIQTKRECIEDGQVYPDGALIKTEKPCVHCYCMKGDIVCVVQECGTPMENEGKNCTSMPPREGQCCPDTYICEGDGITTETPFEEITTLLPSESTTRKGSVPRKEPGITYTESTISFETEGSGEEDIIPSTTELSDLSTSQVQTEDRLGVTDQVLSSAFTTESPAYEVKEQSSTEPEKGLNTVPSEVIEDEHSKPSVLEHTTTKEEIMTTESPISLVQETSTEGTDKKPGTEAPETTSSDEIVEKTTTIPSVQIEDEISHSSPRDENEVTESISATTEEAKITTKLEQSKTTPSNVISEQTIEPILAEHTSIKSDSVTEVELATQGISGPTEISPQDVYTEKTVTDLTEHSSESSVQEKTTTIHDLRVTEFSPVSEEKEISSTTLHEEITTQISAITESAAPVENYTTQTEISPEESSEPTSFDKNTSSDTVTESEEHRTTVPSIYEENITFSSTPKVIEEVEKATAPTTTVIVNKDTTTEKIVEETGTSLKPSHDLQTVVPTTESEETPTTEQIPELNENQERVSTFAPSTQISPQDEKQDTTELNVITTTQPRDKIQPSETTTTLNPEDNEISEDILPPGRIPGEGDCLFNGATYRNESSVPNINKCETGCKCISSIIKCDPIICSPPPEYMENCQLVYDTFESCCPTYVCEDTKETIPPQSHSQMSGTESPATSPSVECYGDECKLQSPTTLPDLTEIPSGDVCGSEGCEGQIPGQTNISGKEPEKCMGDKCFECADDNCKLPSPHETSQIPSETIPQKCQGSEECQEDKTLCEGEACIFETPTIPEIPIPCKGDSCPEISQVCTSDNCVSSDNRPPKTPQKSEICSDGKSCKQFEEKDCQFDNCTRDEEHMTPPSQPIPPKCNDKDCQQQEPSLGEEGTVATTEQLLLDSSTFLPVSHSTLVSDTTNKITSDITEKSTEVTDHKKPEVFNTERAEVATTQAPQVTETLEGENTVPYDEITEMEIHHTEHPIPSTTELYTDNNMTTKTKETEKEHTESPAVTETQEAFTSSPVESETQREDTFTTIPESTFGATETEKPQTPLSEFKPKQPDQIEQFTKSPEVEQPADSTESKVYEEQTEISDQNVSITSTTPTLQDISGLKTTPEYIEQSTVLPEPTKNIGEPENIPSISEDIELPEKSTELESATTLSPELESKSTKLSPSESEKEVPQEITTQPQEVASISTEEPITQEEMKTDLPAEYATDAFKPKKDHKGTETPLSTDTISYSTGSPLETVEEGMNTPETSKIMPKETEPPTLEEQTERIDSYLTTSQSIIAETTKNPEERITPGQDIQEKEPQPEMQITESSLALDTKPSEEPTESVEPEILSETTVPHISKPTEPSIIQESTSEEERLTERPMELGTELSIPVSITENPSIDTKETEESQKCDSEIECKKTQIPQTEITPCHGDSCVIEKEGCESSDCTQSGLPPKITPIDICDEESGCKKPSQEECTDENCRKTEISGPEHEKTTISDTDITTKAPGFLEEELLTEIPFKPHLTETEAPATDVFSLGTEETIKEPIGEEPEKEVTELPESLITMIPLTTESDKYYTSKQTDITQSEEFITPKYAITTIGPQDLNTEHPSSHEVIPQEQITLAPQEPFPTEQQGEVTEALVPVEVTGVKESSTIAPELSKSTESSDGITEEPKISSPEENELTVKPDKDETFIPEQQEFELPQSEVPTTGYSEVTSLPVQDHELMDGEQKTEHPESIFTTLDSNTRGSEITISQQFEDELPKTTEAVITEIPQVTEKSTEPKQEFSETTPFLVELEEHTHKVEESISTLLPFEEPTTEELTDIHVTEEQIIEMSTQKSSQTESTVHYTEKPSDGISSETIRPDSPSTISEEIFEKTSEPSSSVEVSSETTKPTSSDIQVSVDRFTTETKDQENDVSTIPSTLLETKQTTHIPSETRKPQTAIEDNVPQTIHDTISSTAGTFETTAPEEELMQVTTKTTIHKTDEEVTTQSPPAFDKYSKPETSTDVYPSTHAVETQKPVFTDTPPTDEAPQPEEESHFPPSGSYEPEPDYPEEEQFGPGTCRYGGKVYVSAQQIPRDDPCDFCFCFRSDIICLQQSCPPPIHGCHEEPIQGFCCPRYECPVSMATTLNVTTTTTTTTTTLPPHFLPHAYKGAAQRRGCQIKGHIYKVGEVVRASSGPCLHCTCGGDGQMKCDPKVCTPEPMLRQMIAAAVSAKKRR